MSCPTSNMAGGAGWGGEALSLPHHHPPIKGGWWWWGKATSLGEVGQTGSPLAADATPKASLESRQPTEPSSTRTIDSTSEQEKAPTP